MGDFKGEKSGETLVKTDKQLGRGRRIWKAIGDHLWPENTRKKEKKSRRISAYRKLEGDAFEGMPS